MDAETMKYLTIGIVCLVMFGVAKGVSEIFTTIISSVSRNPNAKKDVTVFAWVGAGMTEAIALYALVVALLLIFR